MRDHNLSIILQENKKKEKVLDYGTQMTAIGNRSIKRSVRCLTNKTLLACFLSKSFKREEKLFLN